MKKTKNPKTFPWFRLAAEQIDGILAGLAEHEMGRPTMLEHPSRAGK